jgi:hypothetical protein
MAASTVLTKQNGWYTVECQQNASVANNGDLALVLERLGREFDAAKSATEGELSASSAFGNSTE